MRVVCSAGVRATLFPAPLDVPFAVGDAVFFYQAECRPIELCSVLQEERVE